MIRGIRPHQSGFTVIEIIIVMSVSIALVASAVALFSTRIPRTQFAQAVNDLDIKLKSVGTDVLNGFYPNSNNLQCSGISVTEGSAQQGTNADCIFIGRAIQFGAESDSCRTSNPRECDTFAIYTVFGRRQVGDNITTSLSAAEPRLTNQGVERYTTGYGLRVTRVIDGAGNPVDINGAAYLATFGSRPANTVDQAPSGASQVELRTLSIDGGQFGLAESSFASSSLPINTQLGGPNPVDGIRLCLQSGTSNQFALVTLGEAGRPLSNRVDILSETEWRGVGCQS